MNVWLLLGNTSRVRFTADDIDEVLERLQGDLPKAAKADSLAAFVMAVTQGIAMQAKAGEDSEMLEAVADQELSAWPARFSLRLASRPPELRGTLPVAAVIRE